jgi:hypothetical protein
VLIVLKLGSYNHEILIDLGITIETTSLTEFLIKTIVINDGTLTC